MQGAVDFLPHHAHLAGSVYEDEAALPSFAETATAQGSLEGAQQSGVCKLPSNRQGSLIHNCLVHFQPGCVEWRKVGSYCAFLDIARMKCHAQQETY